MSPDDHKSDPQHPNSPPTTTVSSRYQTVIPSEIRGKFLVREGSRIAWIDKGSSIEIVPLPDKPWKAFRGAGKGGTDYLEALRAYRQKEREEEAKDDGNPK